VAHSACRIAPSLASPETDTSSEWNLLDIVPVKPVDQRVALGCVNDEGLDASHAGFS
jgi:hypothetical protein